MVSENIKVIGFPGFKFTKKLKRRGLFSSPVYEDACRALLLEMDTEAIVAVSRIKADSDDTNVVLTVVARPGTALNPSISVWERVARTVLGVSEDADPLSEGV